MIFRATTLAGAVLIEPEPFRDSRGSFMRTFCTAEFATQDLATEFPQHSISTSCLAGTLRGLHFQAPPHAEIKLVRCIAGAVHDVIVDVRRHSPTFGHWEAFELSAANGRALIVPEGFAHGHQTLEDDTALLYLISKPYAAHAASGIRFDDPRLGIPWPRAISAISERDRSWPLLDGLDAPTC